MRPQRRTTAAAEIPAWPRSRRTRGEPVLVAPPAPVAEQRPARDPRREIHFFCDQMDLDADGHLTVVGWAVCAIGISAITVHLDDQEMGDAELGLPRDDVGDEYRHIPMARYAGFRFARIARRRAGRRTPHPRGAAQRARRCAGRGPHRPDRACAAAAAAASPPQFRLEIDTPHGDVPVWWSNRSPDG